MSWLPFLLSMLLQLATYVLLDVQIRRLPSEQNPSFQDFNPRFYRNTALLTLLIGLVLQGLLAHKGSENEAKYDQLLSENHSLRDMFRISPGLPEVTLNTKDGLPLPTTGNATIGENEQRLYRWQVLQLENTNRVNLHSLDMEMVLPEAVIAIFKKESTAGINLQFEPVLSTMVGVSIGGGSVTQAGRSRVTGRWLLKLDVIPAGGVVRIDFITATNGHAEEYSHLYGSGLHSEWPLYLQGKYSFVSEQRVILTNFFGELSFDRTTRWIQSKKIESSSGPRVTGGEMF